MACRIDSELCKTPNEVKFKDLDYTAFLANVRLPGVVYLTDEVVRPPRANGFQYRATGDGQSGLSTPNFHARDGALVTDGTLIWAAEPINNDSLRATIVTSTWSADDTSISFTNEALDNTGGRQRTSANIGGGIAGGAYTVVNTVTFSDGEIEERGIALEVAA